MNINPAAQAQTFLACLTLGAGLGVLYDLLGVFRRRLPRWAGEGLDLLFWLAALGTLFGTAMLLGDGRVRLYMGCGLALGAGWYAALLHPPVRRGLEGLITGGIFLLKTVTGPIRAVILILQEPLIETVCQVKNYVQNRFPFSLMWSKIYHLAHRNRGRAPCPSEEETEASHRVPVQKGWSSGEDPAASGGGLHGLYPGERPAGDRQGQG